MLNGYLSCVYTDLVYFVSVAGDDTGEELTLSFLRQSRASRYCAYCSGHRLGRYRATTEESAVSCSLLALPWMHENACALPGKLKYAKRAESKNVKFKFLLFCMRCLPQTEPSSIKANQIIYSTSVLHHHHSSYLEKWQACILSYEIFISCDGEENDSALNFSLFCLNQTMLAWQERENWVAIQISWKINYSSVPLSFSGL